MSQVTFADRITARKVHELTKAMANAVARKGDDGGAYETAFDGLAVGAFRGHITQLARMGRLAPIENPEGLDLPPVEAWGRIVDGLASEADWTLAARTFFQPVLAVVAMGASDPNPFSALTPLQDMIRVSDKGETFGHLTAPDGRKVRFTSRHWLIRLVD